MATQTTGQTPDLVGQFERLLPLEAGNNFRDFGGYKGEDNRTIRTGVLFRSGVMTQLTASDQSFLNELSIGTIIDFRSREEIELFPNHWASNHQLKFVAHDYSIKEFYAQMRDDQGNTLKIEHLYEMFPKLLIPQLKLFFQQLIECDSPTVVNCSAGQDRTGLAVALVLHTLGVPWETILEDYHLSTRYRRPEIENRGIDLSHHAESNAFARMMLRYGSNDKRPVPLFDQHSEPYLKFSFSSIAKEYGSIASYLQRELRIDSATVNQIRLKYLV